MGVGGDEARLDKGEVPAGNVTLLSVQEPELRGCGVFLSNFPQQHKYAQGGSH